MKIRMPQFDTQPRRNFLKLLFAGTAATCARGINAEESTPDESNSSVQADDTKKGYRLTSHIDKYYRKAGF